MKQNSIILRGGYDKGYKFFIKKMKILLFVSQFICLHPNFFSIKTYIFSELLKKYKNYKVNFFKIQVLLIYELGNKNHIKNINDQNFAHFMKGVKTKGGYDKGFYGISFTIPNSQSITLSRSSTLSLNIKIWNIIRTLVLSCTFLFKSKTVSCFSTSIVCVFPVSVFTNTCIIYTMTIHQTNHPS